MKLNNPPRFNSFYESFSDLIFATMAIFVLLMLIFLVQVSSASPEPPQPDPVVVEDQVEDVPVPTEDVEKLKREIDALRQENEAQSARLQRQAQQMQDIQGDRESAEAQAAQQAQDLKKSAEMIEKLEGKLESKPLELVVAVDTTASMGEGLVRLNETISTIARVMPLVTSEFRIGIVAYRQGERSRKLYTTLPMTEVKPTNVDGGRSLARVRSFVGRLRPLNGRAPVREAVDVGLGMLKPQREEGTRQIFMLLGDVGPYESNPVERSQVGFRDEYRHISAQEQRIEQQILRDIASWRRAQDKRDVVSVYQWHPANNGEDVARRNWHNITCQKFFKRVAESAGQPQNFTANTGDMLALLLIAIMSEQ